MNLTKYLEKIAYNKNQIGGKIMNLDEYNEKASVNNVSKKQPTPSKLSEINSAFTVLDNRVRSIKSVVAFIYQGDSLPKVQVEPTNEFNTIEQLINTLPEALDILSNELRDASIALNELFS